MRAHATYLVSDCVDYSHSTSTSDATYPMVALFFRSIQVIQKSNGIHNWKSEFNFKTKIYFISWTRKILIVMKATAYPQRNLEGLASRSVERKSQIWMTIIRVMMISQTNKTTLRRLNTPQSIQKRVRD